MNTVTIEEAKQNLVALVERAAHGEPFLMVAEPGKPDFEIIAIERPKTQLPRSVGFLEGSFQVPNDFDSMHAKEIQRLFEGRD